MISIVRSGVLAALFVSLPTVPSGAEPSASDGWLTSVPAALEAARTDQRLILVDLWADWCTWCKKLDEEVFSDPEFREYAKSYVLLRVNTEDGADGARLKEQFDVAGLPTTLIISADQIKVGELQGFAPPGPFMQNLELEKALFGMLTRSYDEVDENTSPDTLKTLADDFHSRRDGRRASHLYERLLATAPDSPEESAWNRYYFADSLRLSGDLERALEVAGEARRLALSADEEEVIELADLLPYYVARDRQACDEARDTLESYLEQHPEGIYLDLAEAALEGIRKSPKCP